MDDQENSIRSHFGRRLADRMRATLGSQAMLLIVVRSIGYGSLDISLDAVFSALDKIGIEPDDLVSLVETYTPLALADVTQFGKGDLKATATGNVITKPLAEEKEISHEKPTLFPKSRGERIWWIANTSLVLPAVILLIASYSLFKAADDEHKELLGAVIRERELLVWERENVVRHYADSANYIWNYLKLQTKHFGDLEAIENKLLDSKIHESKGQDASRAAP